MPGKILLPIDTVNQIIALYKQGFGAKSVAKKLSINSSVVKRILRENNVYDSNRKPRAQEEPRSKRSFMPPDIQDKVVAKYKNGTGVKILSEEFEYTKFLIIRILKEHNVYDSDRVNPKTFIEQKNIDDILQKHKEGLSPREISEVFNYSSNIIKRILKENNAHNLDKNYVKIEVPQQTINKMKEMYIQGDGARKIAEVFKYDRSVVIRILKEQNIYDSNRITQRTMVIPLEKVCKQCKEIKKIDLFRKRISQYADGSERISYEAICKDCDRFNYNERLKIRDKELRKTDPAYRIHKSVSYSIWCCLKNNDSSKNNQSCSQFLTYSDQELKEHLEKQFESWMSWNNYGAYRRSVWDDNDPSTWTWQIDHIIPQSDLPYQSMEDEKFKICWSLTNLRPYSSKQNLLDGVQRNRHKNKKD